MCVFSVRGAYFVTEKKLLFPIIPLDWNNHHHFLLLHIVIILFMGVLFDIITRHMSFKCHYYFTTAFLYLGKCEQTHVS